MKAGALTWLTRSWFTGLPVFWTPGASLQWHQGGSSHPWPLGPPEAVVYDAPSLLFLWDAPLWRDMWNFINSKNQVKRFLRSQRT
ncbi:hypothetical protein CBM2625_U10029 [Cupriavidus taiwanensis]|nr:hypothetical protein CBM2625_U10029 [Cupriavidus taiwanensis]